MSAIAPEINDIEKVYLLDTVESLASQMTIAFAEPPANCRREEDDQIDGAEKNKLHLIEMSATYAFDRTIIQMDASEIFDYEFGPRTIGCVVMTLQSGGAGPKRLIVEKTYSVSRQSDEPAADQSPWSCAFEQSETIYKGQGVNLTVKRLGASLEELTDPRINTHDFEEAEERERVSVLPYEFRLTRPRYWNLLSLLDKLRPEHLLA